MIKLVRTDSDNTDFKTLIEELDAYLKITDGDEHEFYNQFNGVSIIKNVVVAYIASKAIGCGAFKIFNTQQVEIKRMYTKPKMRGLGVASEILTALELWAAELNFSEAILETGTRQKEAVAFYKKNDYMSIPNYAQYQNMDNSLCFKKKL
ncbi:MAG: GNAT family N-acetyltransferase [Psychroserpens sp.]|uniref:GNAT family N-acetyltransferase n=1 Tax=Psychroserpens sp. TaxID=2020870 RepID=UPI003CB1D263